MTGIVSLLGVTTLKPVLTALLIPPVPLLLLALGCVWRMRVRRRAAGWPLVLMLATLLGLWLSACGGVAAVLEPLLLPASAPLTAQRLAELKAEMTKTTATPALAIVVLGGGAEPLAPEYGQASLTAPALERLRYGVWLARQTGAPLAFSGGLGWAGRQSELEADIAARIAAEEFGQPLRWRETQSRDTRENATLTLPLLQQAGVKHIVLVTHGWHMPRAKGLFEVAATAHGIRVEAAPMGLAQGKRLPVLEWLPSSDGFRDVRQVMREWWALRLGA